MTSGLTEVVELLKEAVPDSAARVSQFLAALFVPWHRLPAQQRAAQWFAQAGSRSRKASIVSPTTGLDYLLEAVLLIKIVYDQEAGGL